MSAAGKIWTDSPDKDYGTGPGLAPHCVQYIDCPTCGAPKGSLCIGPNGPHLDRHYKRAYAYTALKRDWLRFERNVRKRPRDRRTTKRTSLSFDQGVERCGFMGCSEVGRYCLYGRKDTPQFYCCFVCAHGFMEQW